MSKSLGLRPTLLYKSEDDILTFKNVVVPSSMRSPLWKYFGFPADENREIITRAKIVCCICYTIIAYNKNTTNLSAHLTNKHPETLIEIKRDSRTSANNMDSPISPKRKPKAEMTVNWYTNDDDVQHSIVPNEMQQKQHPTGITQKTYPRSKKSIYKPKFQVTLDDMNPLDEDEPEKSSFDDITEHEHDDQFIETIHYDNIDIHEDGNEIIAEVLDSKSVTLSNRSENDFLSTQYITINENNEVLYESSSKKMEGKSTKLPQKLSGSSSSNDHRITAINSADIIEQIKKFLIKDLIMSSIVDGSGFREMISFLSHNTDVPNSVQIKTSIENDYKQQYNRAISDVKSALDSRCYSLLFHRLGNSSIVEISINYWLDGSDRINGISANQILGISKNCTNFLLSFGESLSNCSAFVVDFDLKNDLTGTEVQELISDIPVIPTFSYVTKMAFEACLQLSAIQTAVKSADEFMGGKVKAANTWLQKFECLSQFLNEPNDIENSQIIQVLVECMQPLKNCLYELAFVTSAYASIMKPLVSQLINQYYSDSIVTQSTESDIVVLEKDLKQTILKVFQQHVIESSFLGIASFLDPRFQSLTASDDLNLIRDKLETSAKNDEATSVACSSDAKQSRLKNNRNFGLSSLFSNLLPNVKTKPPKNRFDIELRSYRESVSLSVEMCPLAWWDQNESLYPTLKKYVKSYFCVPSFVDNLHRMCLAEQEEVAQKYKRLENSEFNEKLLWLHLNELRQRSFEDDATTTKKTDTVDYS